MEAKIQKWGNSFGIRIPLSVIKDLSLRNGSIVDIDEEPDRLIISPRKRKSLDDLIDGITNNNIHSEIDFGKVEGNEIW